MKWKKEVKEVGWYWICEFHYYNKGEFNPSIWIDCIQKDENGYFNKDDKYCFMGPIEVPKAPNYKSKKVSDEWIADVETEKENIVNLEGKIPGTIDMGALAKELDKLDKEYQQNNREKKIIKGKR
jgi:hypothetical protein